MTTKGPRIEGVRVWPATELECRGLDGWLHAVHADGGQDIKIFKTRRTGRDLETFLNDPNDILSYCTSW